MARQGEKPLHAVTKETQRFPPQLSASAAPVPRSSRPRSRSQTQTVWTRRGSLLSRRPAPALTGAGIKAKRPECSNRLCRGPCPFPILLEPGPHSRAGPRVTGKEEMGFLGKPKSQRLKAQNTLCSRPEAETGSGAGGVPDGSSKNRVPAGALDWLDVSSRGSQGSDAVPWAPPAGRGRRWGDPNQERGQRVRASRT